MECNLAMQFNNIQLHTLWTNLQTMLNKSRHTQKYTPYDSHLCNTVMYKNRQTNLLVRAMVLNLSTSCTDVLFVKIQQTAHLCALFDIYFSFW